MQRIYHTALAEWGRRLALRSYGAVLVVPDYGFTERKRDRGLS